MISKLLSTPRQNVGRKALLFLVFFSCAVPLVAAQDFIYHPYLHRTFALSTIDPEYLWKHLEDPLFQQYNDMNQVRNYLEIYALSSPDVAALQIPELQAMGISRIYDPTIRQYVSIGALQPSQVRRFLQDPLSRRNTLSEARLRPPALKAYYIERERPLLPISERPAFRNTALCIVWYENGRFLRDAPAGCGSI